MTESVKLEILEVCPDEIRKELTKNLVAFNSSKAEEEDYQSLTVLARCETSSALIGGLLGHTHWRWLSISQLWVAEEYRGKGFGAKLLALAEEEAIARNCFGVLLDTFDFQALDFYLKLGFEVFAKLDNFPVGHTRYYLRKNLAKTLPAK